MPDHPYEGTPLEGGCRHEIKFLRHAERNGEDFDYCDPKRGGCGKASDGAIWFDLPPKKKPAKPESAPADRTIVVTRRTPENRASWMQGARYVLKALVNGTDTETITFALDAIEDLDRAEEAAK